MDVLLEVLSGAKLNGTLFFHAELSAPWGVRSPGAAALVPALAPGAQEFIVYLLVIDGGGNATLPDGASTTLAPGDVVVFPRGDAHLLSNGCETEVPLHTLQAQERILAHDLSMLRTGGGGQTTRFVCGFMACDQQLGRSIFSGFPPCFKVNVRTDSSGSWLENSILHLVSEAVSGRPGAEAVLSKLSEALFVDVVRRYVESIPADRNDSWLAGIRDPVVGRCLSLLHNRVDYSWTLADLARAAGISRSALAERFNRFLAEPPMTYLTRWRLQLAARALGSTSKGVADIAASVGYESEAAFTRAFKRGYGVPPARYRREMRLMQGRTAPRLESDQTLGIVSVG